MSSFWCLCLFRSGCELGLLMVDEKQKQSWFTATIRVLLIQCWYVSPKTRKQGLLRQA